PGIVLWVQALQRGHEAMVRLAVDPHVDDVAHGGELFGSMTAALVPGELGHVDEARAAVGFEVDASVEHLCDSGADDGHVDSISIERHDTLGVMKTAADPGTIRQRAEVLDRAAEAIDAAEVVVITAGAGLGVDSGIPDYRSSGGFWQQYGPLEKLGFKEPKQLGNWL